MEGSRGVSRGCGQGRRGGWGRDGVRTYVSSRVGVYTRGRVCVCLWETGQTTVDEVGGCRHGRQYVGPDLG